MSAAAAPVAASSSEDEVAPQERPSGDVRFEAAFDLHQPGGLQPQLRGGEVAATDIWPASVYTTFAVSNGRRAACTAALIGPRVMLTAAHCVPTAGTVTVDYDGHASPYAATCTQHPRFSSDPSADYALCTLDRPFAAPANFRYETVDTTAMNGLVGRRAVLTGFGCISDIVAENQSDKKYRIGFNVVIETSASTQRSRDDRYYVPAQRNNLFTSDDPGLANLCPGDSGGPAFRQLTGDLRNRMIIGINSRVFYADGTRTSYGASLISATGAQDFRDWAAAWIKTNNVAACGLSGELPCRS